VKHVSVEPAHTAPRFYPARSDGSKTDFSYDTETEAFLDYNISARTGTREGIDSPMPDFR
jgi:hypothetical protein